MGLSTADVRRLSAIPPEQLDSQAAGLIRKRYHEAARLIPETMSRLGSRSVELFAGFAEGFWPDGHRRHEIDAMEFCRHLAEAGLCATARFEANALRFVIGSRRFAVHFVRTPGESRRWTWQCLVRRKTGIRQFRGRLL